MRRGLLTAALLALTSGVAMPAGATAAGQPEVAYQPATEVTSTGATIAVEIDPEGEETSYEIFLECQSPTRLREHCEPLSVDPQRQTGVLAASSERQVVTAPVTGLQPDYLYEFGMVARNAAGHNGFIRAAFVTCPTPPTPCPSQSYSPGISILSIESAEREAAELYAHAVEERAAKKAAEERAAREAAEREAAREAAERSLAEAAERARRQACVVPRLEGDSAAKAARVLGRAHCALGKRTRLAGASGPLVVVGQDAPRGRRLAAGARVAVTLGRPPAHQDANDVVRRDA